MPKAVFFDWDGTLVDSLAFITNAHNHVRNSLGISPELTKDEFHHYLGMPRAAIFNDLYGDLAAEGEAGFVKYYNDNHLTDIKLIEGAKELVETLFWDGVYLGVVSNKRSDFLHSEVFYAGFASYFFCVVGSGDTDEDKPSAKPLNYAITEMNKFGRKYELDDIWYVGDTDIDIQCANNAGVVSILYNPKEINISATHGLNIEQMRYFSIKKYEEICGFLLQSL